MPGPLSESLSLLLLEPLPPLLMTSQNLLPCPPSSELTNYMQNVWKMQDERSWVPSFSCIHQATMMELYLEVAPLRVAFYPRLVIETSYSRLE